MVLHLTESFVDGTVNAESAAVFADLLEKIAHMGVSVALTGDIDIGYASEDVFAVLPEAGTDGGGARITLAETGTLPDETRPELAIADSSIIGKECDGANEALLQSGVPNPERVAEKLGMYDPDYNHGNDPHWPESAALEDGTRFVRYEDGSIEVFDKNGHRIAAMDSDGSVVQPYEGSMMNSTPCQVCPSGEHEADGYTPVGEAAEVVPSELPPRIVPMLTIVACPDGGECVIEYRNFLVFSSEAQMRAFFADTERAAAFFAALENNGSCIYISDGVGSVQIIELEMRNGEVVMRDGVPVLDDELKTTTFNNGRYHMSDKLFEERYLRGLGGPAEVRRDGLQDVRTSDIPFPGLAQELHLNAETNRYEFEPVIESEKRVARAMVESAGIDVDTFMRIADIELPAEFDDPNADIGKRAEALREAAARQSVTLSEGGARNLARLLTEAQGQDASLRFNERTLRDARYPNGDALTISTTQPDGTRTTLREAVAQSAQNNVAIWRAVQGIPQGS